MKTKQDHPGVYPPPPLFYVLTFLSSVFLQKQLPLPKTFFGTVISSVAGFIFILFGLIIVVPALYKFLISKNTLITIKPARSLQTTGIYSISRNPMYLGLLSIYSGMGFIKGNSWTFILIPLVITLVNFFVISNEEKYLGRAFGDDYTTYKNNVRRWI